MQPIYFFPGALNRADTESLRQAAEHRGFQATGTSYPPSYRDNDRQVFDDPGLADWLFQRIGHLLPDSVKDGQGVVWARPRLNSRFRFCRYRDGQAFSIHRDGVYHEQERARSMLTFMVYLNDADEFVGGETRFYRGRDPDNGTLLRVSPESGALIVFDHALWHDGAPVTQGTKMVMRSDVVYQCAEYLADAHTGGHLGYIWQLVALTGGLVASAGRDGTVRRWRVRGSELEPVDVLGSQESVASHGSVTALVENRPGELWAGDRAGRLRVWREQTLVADFQAHEGAILSLACLPGGRPGGLPDGLIASASADGTIALFDRKYTRVATLVGHEGWVWDLAVRSDGVLVSGGEDGEVRLWSPNSERVLARLRAGAPVRSVLATRDWRIVAGLADGFLSLWDGCEVRTRERAHGGAVRTLAENQTGTLASGGEDGLVHVWELGHLTRLASHRHSDFVTSVIELPDGAWASASYDSAIHVWPASARVSSP